MAYFRNLASLASVPAEKNFACVPAIPVGSFAVGRRLGVFLGILVLHTACGFGLSGNMDAADLPAAEKLFFAGQYRECAEIAGHEFHRGVWNDGWPKLLIRCQLATGQYDAARATYAKAIERFGSSIGLRLLGYDVYRYVNLPALAQRELDRIYEVASRAPSRYSSADDRITLGKFFLLRNQDARQVLELFYDRARRSNARLPAVYIATAELALQKHDYQVAADALERAAELQGDNPQIHYLQALAWKESEWSRAAIAITRALELNPRHVPSLLFQADHLIDAERYTEAADALTRVLEVNLYEPQAWAYHAVIAHLEGHARGEGLLRGAALEPWKSNPLIDHLIGKKLSQKYRFSEGAAYQRRALRMQSDYAPAKFQLSQDLLRLGQDDEDAGWALADEVHTSDGYNVVAYNLITLRDQLKQFATLTADGFVVRMEEREARIYGQQVLELLREAREVLCRKYDVALDGSVIIEIFPQQKDFAIRTFGLPGGVGYLGVCFGRVITANSPASQGDAPANWRSVLWHEFCHVVTLEKSDNKMPRWLSEGISVYEERLRNPSWGEQLTPQYREMLLADKLTPVSELSAAFLRPESPMHLQFAYYESSLVVEYLIDRYGLEILKRVLVDLSVGMPINMALERYVGSLEQLDAGFAEYARLRAKSLAPDMDWQRDEELDATTPEALAAYLKQHPNNYWALQRSAAAAIRERNWSAAKQTLERLRNLYPDDTSPGNAHALLARAYRELGDVEQERIMLEHLAELDDNDTDTYIRLMELNAARGDWDHVYRDAQRMLSVNPLLPIGHERLAEAGEHLGKHAQVAAALESLLEMNPVDPAASYFRLAQALVRIDQPDRAKRHVLMALEEAPRYRAAQHLLLELAARPPNSGDRDAGDREDREEASENEGASDDGEVGEAIKTGAAQR